MPSLAGRQLARPSRRLDLAFAAWMLGCACVAFARHEPLWGSAGGLIAAGVASAAAWRSWTPSGRFGLANSLTAFRLVLVAGLPLLFHTLPRMLFGALVLALLVLDGLDGWLARARGEASAFGASLDMETDALAILVLGLLLWQQRIVGPWVLVAGLWRYVYAALVALLPSLGEAPRTRFGRAVFVILYLCFAGAFAGGAVVPSILAAVGTTLVSISFVRSLVQSRARAQTEASADKSSRAASAQVRGGSRTA